MPIVTWCDDFNINVEEIDLQHQKLLELVNNLHSSVEACIDKKELEERLIELVAFTRFHFSTEHRLMKEHNYPELASHHKEHNFLLQHMDRLVVAVSSGKHPHFYSDYDVSSDWALTHISDYDRSLGTFLNTKNVY